MSDKTLENRLRRMAGRQGLVLRKSRSRDPRAVDYGLYALIDVETCGAIHPHNVLGPYDLTLEDVRRYIEDGEALEEGAA